MSTGLVGVDVVWVVLGAIAVVPLLLMLLEVGYRVIKPSVPLQGTHVIVVGGSTGIGLSMAIQAAKERARAITLVSRSQEKLQAARQAVLASAADPGCAVDTISADATNFKTMAVAIDSAVQTHGPPDYLICAAGASHPGYFLQQPVETFRDSMELNYMGTVVCLKAAVPHMAAVRQGHCILISSGAGLSGWLGYSSYSPTKFAIRGLAEALRNELTGFNIKVSIAYPPDTDTPGFEHENKTKPVETVEMLPPSTYSPAMVASYIWYSVGKGDFNCSCPDLIQDFLIALMSGVTPRRMYIFDAIMHPIMLIVATVFRWNADRISSAYPKRIEGSPVSTDTLKMH
ncbi:3-dehydrosphinganine reductase [Plasmodiophora brassicae]|uniref:3-dehydrosphinganine reductase n=2 Tax=Plasmodiophora brassicae TaxID=37360 RepID=A0A3P3YCM0_PLABS|nr:unnamed protein product [Plasmodiophora brassicae]